MTADELIEKLAGVDGDSAVVVQTDGPDDWGPLFLAIESTERAGRHLVLIVE